MCILTGVGFPGFPQFPTSCLNQILLLVDIVLWQQPSARHSSILVSLTWSILILSAHTWEPRHRKSFPSVQPSQSTSICGGSQTGRPSGCPVSCPSVFTINLTPQTEQGGTRSTLLQLVPPSEIMGCRSGAPWTRVDKPHLF